MAAHTTGFSKELFDALLGTLTPLRSNIGTLVKIALNNLPHHQVVSSSLLDHLSKVEIDSMECRALWYLLDALMKETPLVFVPAFAPQLAKLVETQIPWQLLLQRRKIDRTTGREEPTWFEEMISSWEGLLQHDTQRDVNKTLAKQRSSRELQRELAFAENLAVGAKRKRHGQHKEAEGGDGTAEEEKETAASKHQLARFDREWSHFKRLLATEIVDNKTNGSEENSDDSGDEDAGDKDAAAAGAAVPTETSNTKNNTDKAGANSADSDSSDFSDSDSDGEEYCPGFIDGAGKLEIGGWDEDDAKGGKGGKRVARTRKR